MIPNLSAERVRILLAGTKIARPLSEHEKNDIVQHKPHGIQANRKGKPGPKAKGVYGA